MAAEVAASATDNGLLLPMLRKVRETTGRLAATTVVDAGYHSANNLAAAAGEATTLYVADPALGRKGRDPQGWVYHKDHFQYNPVSDSYVCPEGQRLGYAYSETRGLGRRRASTTAVSAGAAPTGGSVRPTAGGGVSG